MEAKQALLFRCFFCCSDILYFLVGVNQRKCPTTNTNAEATRDLLNLRIPPNSCDKGYRFISFIHTENDGFCIFFYWIWKRGLITFSVRVFLVSSYPLLAQFPPFSPSKNSHDNIFPFYYFPFFFFFPYSYASLHQQYKHLWRKNVHEKNLIFMILNHLLLLSAFYAVISFVSKRNKITFLSIQCRAGAGTVEIVDTLK